MEYISDNMIFGLDIGTRSIVGIVGIKEKSGFKILASHVKLHETRSMLDGQIHDIDQVAKTITEVKEILEKKLNKKLKKVCIAAAGRVLKTLETRIEVEIDDKVEINRDMVLSLELQGMEKAMHQINYVDADDTLPFYCVGYSVTNYYLNDFMMKNLEGHKGSTMAAEVLSTFLPSEVVGSLYKVVEKSGLEVYSLTLEPIAAIEVAIPENYRLLNIALIDIGAGTSDIAITKNGSIIAYGMIPYAGDEVTESIVHEYLVDFKTAEKLKIKASGRAKTVTFKDAIGLKQTVELEHVRQIMSTANETLARKIAEKVTELNGGHPTNAVFVVGGGGRIKGFDKLLAKEIELPFERVALRGKDVLSQVEVFDKDFKKLPEYVTPVGICLTGINNNAHDFVEVFLNDETIRIFNTNRLKVMDVVALKGIDPKTFISKYGKSLSYELNGKKKEVKGNIGQAAKIYVNQKEADLSTPISMHDYINIIPAVDGKEPEIYIKDIIGNPYIMINGQKVIIETTILCNKQKSSLLKRITDQDVIEVHKPSLEDLLHDRNETFTHIFINEKEASSHSKYEFGDQIVTFKDEQVLLGNSDLHKEEKNEENVKSLDKEEEVSEPVGGIHLLVNGEMIHMKGKAEFKFIDIFDYIDFDRRSAKGSLITKINNTKCSYMDKVDEGDQLEIYWNTK